MVWEEGPPSFFKATNSLRKTNGYNKKLIISGIFFYLKRKIQFCIFIAAYIKIKLILINIFHHEEDNRENWEMERESNRREENKDKKKTSRQKERKTQRKHKKTHTNTVNLFLTKVQEQFSKR